MKQQGIASRLNTYKSSLNTRQFEFQLMILPGLIFLFIFYYLPMYGTLVAFKDYNIAKGFAASPWAGFAYFQEFLETDRFWRAVKNSLGINIMQLFLSFPAPIIFALLLNEVRHKLFKRVTQTISYLPHFVSWVIFGGFAYLLLEKNGAINELLQYLGIIKNPVFFMGKPEYFWPVAVFTGIAKSFGWGSIIYLAAITGVDIALYDSATVDGAGRFQKMFHITLPSIKGTIAILLIFNISTIFATGFDHIYMLYNPLNASMSETLEVYVYKVGLQNFQFSYAAAVDLTKAVLAFILLTGANFASKKLTEEGLY